VYALCYWRFPRKKALFAPKRERGRRREVDRDKERERVREREIERGRYGCDV